MEWYWITLISAGSLYFILALLLFIFPICKKKKPIIIDTAGNKYVLGTHRGGSKERLENTIPAFTHSRDLGINILEMDVHMTKDKQVVVHHDKSLARLTGLERDVEDVNFDEIPPWMDEVGYPFGDGVYKQKQGIDSGKIPLLRDVFSTLPGIPMNIDLKGGSPEQAEIVAQLIVEFKRENITYFGDMNEKRNLIARRIGESKGIRTYASAGYTFRTILLYLFGILQFFPFKHYSVWYPFFGKREKDLIYNRFGRKWLVWTFLQLYSWFTWLMKPMFWHLKRKGVFIMFWVVDSEGEIDRLRGYPMHGFITDKPSLVRKKIDSLTGNRSFDTPIEAA